MTRLARDPVRELPHPLYDSALWVWQGVIFVQVPDTGFPGVPPDKETTVLAKFAAALNLRLPPDKGAAFPLGFWAAFCKLAC